MSATTTPTVFITVPKFVTITPAPITIRTAASALPKIRPAPAALCLSPSPSSSGYASSTSGCDDSTMPVAVPKGKKRRLDHLTVEEKVQRKKLKNRVAAQTSRDRKKARMEEMECEIQELNEKTEILQNKCEVLQAGNESLLEKNQKLDQDLANMKQQLMALQQSQREQQQNVTAISKSVTTCAGCESLLKGSAAGIKTNEGLTVDTRATTQQQQPGRSLEDCCSLPALQDILFDEEAFDANKLEELAESLLADISADLEASHRKSNASVAEVASSSERLLGSVVGTTAECLESSQHRSFCIDQQPQTHNQDHLETLQNDLHTLVMKTTAANSIPSLNNENKSEILDSETVYGTYDAQGNCITITLGDNDEPVNEAVEEICCDGNAAENSLDGIKCPCSPVASPSQVFLNVDVCSDDEDDDLNFDPIAKFLCPKRPIVSPLGRSPVPSMHSATSDHGYESIIGSPPTTTNTLADSFDVNMEDFSWSETFNDLDLFPNLIEV